MDHLTALERAIMHIEDHLGEDITVEEVASTVGYSYYHLTRLFSALLGESIGSYIKKRRLADAAQKLLYTDKRVIDIAIENGFGSNEAFSRAFKATYKTGPRDFRKKRLETFITAKDPLEPELLRHRTENITVHPRIVECDEIKIVGVRGTTNLRNNEIPFIWDNLNAIAHTIPHRIPKGRGFGICEACSENTLYTMNDEVVFSEVAGIEVDRFEKIHPPLVPKTIPGGRYAVFTHTGDVRMLKTSFDYIWGTWLLNTKETLDMREDFELYDERFLGRNNPRSQIDIYIPVH